MVGRRGKRIACDQTLTLPSKLTVAKLTVPRTDGLFSLEKPLERSGSTVSQRMRVARAHDRKLAVPSNRIYRSAVLAIKVARSLENISCPGYVAWQSGL